jgi:hypothetical protein
MIALKTVNRFLNFHSTIIFIKALRSSESIIKHSEDDTAHESSVVGSAE